MAEQVWIHATGMLVRDAGKALLERGLALSVDCFETFPMYLKNGKAKLASNSDSVIIVADRTRLEEAMLALRSMCRGSLRAYALPVLAASGIG